jgi:hypothetical protein
VIQILSSHKWYGDFEFEEQSNDWIYLGKFLGFLEYMPEITIAWSFGKRIIDNCKEKFCGQSSKANLIALV